MPAPPAPPVPPPPPPSIDVAKESRVEADEMRRRQGRGATILSQGLLTQPEMPKTGTRKLLGE